MKEFETFKELSSYGISGLMEKEPSCFNSRVRVRRYKIIYELIDEPIEVIQKRIQELWDENDNHYNWGALEAAAKKYNYVIKK